jgi:hypothetical protein
VTTIGASAVSELALPVDEVYAYGQRNTDAEPIAEQGEITAGVRYVTGGSLFTASKAANLGALVPSVFGPAPRGLLFGVPNRELIAYTVPDGPESIPAINALVGFVDGFTHDPARVHPGGVLSGDVYFWSPDGGVERVGGRQPDGESLYLDASGPLGAIIGAD